jgi:hypothetical protein
MFVTRHPGSIRGAPLAARKHLEVPLKDKPTFLNGARYVELARPRLCRR